MLPSKPRQNLTEKQQAFIESLVSGRNPTHAARITGYSTPGQASYLLMRNPKILAVIRLLRQTLYQGELANQALGTFRKVMEDPDAPASARVSSSRTVLELAGELNRDKIDNLSGRSLAELTPDELSSLIDRWEGERMSLAKDVTPAGTG